MLSNQIYYFLGYFRQRHITIHQGKCHESTNSTVSLWLLLPQFGCSHFFFKETNSYQLLFFFLKILFNYFQSEGKGGRKKESERPMCGSLAYPLLGTWPATQACALTGNRTGETPCELVVHRPVLNQLSSTGQGCLHF